MRMSPPVLPDDFAPTVGVDDLLGILLQIQHATAPTHSDGAYHEAAHDLSTTAIDAIYARRRFEAALGVKHAE